MIMTKSFFLIFFSAFFSFSICTAQNYFHVKLDDPIYRSDDIVLLLDHLAQQFDIKNSTFSVRMIGMQKGINATIDYVKVDATGRHMFLIKLNRFHRGESVTTSLIHEMVHAKQYYHEELVRYDRTEYMWNGTHYRNISYIEHHRRPWEIEAHQLSHSMQLSYASSGNLSQLKLLSPSKKEILARKGSSLSKR